jgi:hypothetical protein
MSSVAPGGTFWRVFPGWHFARSTTFKKTKMTGGLRAGHLESCENPGVFGQEDQEDQEDQHPPACALCSVPNAGPAVGGGARLLPRRPLPQRNRLNRLYRLYRLYRPTLAPPAVRLPDISGLFPSTEPTEPTEPTLPTAAPVGWRPRLLAKAQGSALGLSRSLCTPVRFSLWRTGWIDQSRAAPLWTLHVTNSLYTDQVSNVKGTGWSGRVGFGPSCRCNGFYVGQAAGLSSFLDGPAACPT